MIRFILKGVIRDKNRSRLPSIVVATGVMFAVFLHCYLTGILGDMADFTAKFTSGHVKVVTNGYRENMDISPLDLALDNSASLRNSLIEQHPSMQWVERISTGGLIDMPDENGETLKQGPASALAVDLLTPGSAEAERLNLDKVLVKGSIPDAPGEILISDEFAGNLGAKPGDMVTFIGSTMYGSMTIVNFTIAGTIKYGINILDRGAVIMDIADARMALDMEDAASEILGFFATMHYDDERATDISKNFNMSSSGTGEFDPVMIRLRDQNMMGPMLDMMRGMITIISTVFLLALAIILWNTGLIGGLRRYGEVGLRLAVGETRGHIYRSMLAESLAVGITGSIAGTVAGLLLAYWVQVKGIDITGMLKDSTMLMPGVLRTRITPPAFYIGFIPGILSTLLGTMLSGIGIYKRETSSLFKELQA
jgi:putative ABC transport system permease protein